MSITAARGCQHPRACHFPHGCDCAIIESPSIVPDQAPPLATALTTEQERFMWLHANPNDYVKKSIRLLGSSQLRAYSSSGHRVTISQAGVNDLVKRGLMQWGVACSDVKLTDAGREIATAKPLKSSVPTIS